MHLRRRWPGAVMALVVLGGSTALGVTALGVGAASADPAQPCGLLVCPQPAPGPAVPPSYVAPVAGGPGAIETNWTGVAPDGHVKVTATVTWTPTGAPVGAPTLDPANATATVECTKAPGAPTDGTQRCDVAWPTALEDSTYVLNGTYSLVVTAVTCPDAPNLLGCSSGTPPATSSFGVMNVPTPPANVTAKLVTSPGAGVVVAWDRSPEPDVFAYEVKRVNGSQVTAAYGCIQSFAPTEYHALPACDAKPSFIDAGSGGGKFTYQVIAYRFGVNYTKAAARASVPALSKAAVTVAGPPVTGGGSAVKPNILPGSFFGQVKPNTNNAAPVIPPRLGPVTPPTTDPGFNPTLPYAQQQPAATDPPVVAAAAPPSTTRHGTAGVGSIALVGAGVLVIAIALHGLWLRSEVRRTGPLEALEPEI